MVALTARRPEVKTNDKSDLLFKNRSRGWRKHRRLKAGLVRKHKKEFRLKAYQIEHRTDGRAGRLRLKLAQIKAEHEAEKAKIVNARINSKLIRFASETFSDYKKMREFIDEFRPQLVYVLSSALPYSTDERVLSYDTGMRLGEVMKKHGFYFTGTDIKAKYSW